jgi:GntR family transcriptional regulator, carbon starvation induced regulator
MAIATGVPEQLIVRSETARTQTSIAIDLLRADIISARLRPNEKLRVQALVERYGLAASAIREALSRLVTDGLVDVEDQRGFRVGAASREDLLDLTETRVSIESLAITRAIQHGDVDWEAGIVAAFHRLTRIAADAGRKPATDYTLMSEAHRDFHRSLIAACQSEWLLYFCSVLYEQSERYRFLALYSAPRGRNPQAEHEQLMNAVIKRNVERSCRLISEHIHETTRIILELDKSMASRAGTAPRTAT